MTRKRLDGFYFLLLGWLTFLLLGSTLQSMPGTMGDFRIYYYSARCLLRGGDPYKATDALRIWHEEGGDRPTETTAGHAMISRFNNLPTTFSLTAPIALLPYRGAIFVWTALSFLSLGVAGYLVWDLAAIYAPRLAGVLVGFVLANSELVVTNGNVAGICAGLCVIAVWCLIKSRFVALGILCLALSLAWKPQVAIFVWLFFWLSGGVPRKRAMYTLLVVMALGLPIVVWLTHVDSSWLQQLHANMSAFSGRGDMNDPGPTAVETNGATMIINLQTALAYFDDDPNVYNSIAYLISGAISLAWLLVARRKGQSLGVSQIGLATAAALTLLPVYHRQCDAKILLLTIPACAILWSEGGRLSRIALGITALALFVTADIPWAIDVGLLKGWHGQRSGLTGELLIASQMVPVPLILLVESVFYLRIYAKRTRTGTESGTPSIPAY